MFNVLTEQTPSYVAQLSAIIAPEHPENGSKTCCGINIQSRSKMRYVMHNNTPTDDIPTWPTYIHHRTCQPQHDGMQRLMDCVI